MKNIIAIDLNNITTNSLSDITEGSEFIISNIINKLKIISDTTQIITPRTISFIEYFLSKNYPTEVTQIKMYPNRERRNKWIMVIKHTSEILYELSADMSDHEPDPEMIPLCYHYLFDDNYY